jgi:hypothetical protein
MEDVGEQVVTMLNVEASHDHTVEGCIDQVEDDDTIVKLTKIYH